MVGLSKISSAIGCAAAIAGSPALGGVLNASAPVQFYSEIPAAQIPVDLPQYSGPGTITKVVLSVSGTAGGTNWYPYDLENGIDRAGYTASFDIVLFSPDMSVVVDAPVSTSVPGVTIPPCSYEGCGGQDYAYVDANPVTVSADGMALDLADFAGTGSVQLFLIDTSSFSNNSFDGTVSEAIYTSVVEPTTWILLLVGAGLAGASLRARRSAAETLPR